MKLKLLFALLLLNAISFGQGPADYTNRYEFNNNLNNTQGGNSLTTSGSLNYVNDRFGMTTEAIEPNANRLDAPVVNNVSDVSFSFWFKAPASTNAGDIVAITNQNGTSRMIISKNNSNRLVATFTVAGANPSSQLSDAVFDNNWHHIVFTTRRETNSHQNNIYVDGVQGGLFQNINPPVSSGLFVNDGILAIAGSNQFNGTIDDVQVFDRELSTAEVSSIYNSFVNIPDANFKAELVNNSTVNTDGDSEISYTEAQAFTGTINVPNKNISDLTGIAAFSNISILYVNTNQLTSIDVSNNTSLTTIYFSDNQITEIDLSANTNLAVVYAFNNQLTSLNVANGNNSTLNIMRAEGNSNLTCIQHDIGFDPTTNGNWIKDATANWNVNCGPCNNIINIPDANFKAALLDHGVNILGGNIGIIDLDGDGEICDFEASAYSGRIFVPSSSIADLTGIEAFTSLDELLCYGNSLTALDLSSNTALTSLSAYNNQLASLNIANSNNSNMVLMQAFGNGALSCIQHDNGFDPTTNTGWSKDTTANWSDNCAATTCTTIVNIPDTNFKAALLDHGVGITGTGISIIDTDGDGEICTTEAQAYTGTINVENQNISDMTGIETFINITQLSCRSNPSLTSLDVTANTALISLRCFSTSISSLDVSSNSALEILDCFNSQLTSLDVTANTALRILKCGVNQISTIDLSNNIALEELSYANNQVANIDLSANINLERIQLSQNSLTSFDASNLLNLTSLSINQNQLMTLNVANGNNGNGATQLNDVDARFNSNLTCIQHDTGFNPTTNANWEKDASASWSTSCSLGTNDFSFGNIVKLYPNPVNTVLTVSSANTEILKIEIFSILGKKILETSKAVIDVNQLNDGIYFLKIESTEGNIATRKFVKR